MSETASTLEKLASVKAVVTDWDDTKVATFDSLVLFYKDFADVHQLPQQSTETIRGLWGQSLGSTLAQLWPQLTEEALVTQWWAHVEATDFSIVPFATTQETILDLKKEGYVLGIVSSAPHRSIVRTMDRHMPLPPDVYHFIYGADDCAVHKPDPRVFDEALTSLQKVGITQEEQVLYVGDGLNDYQAARARGLPFVAVTTGFTEAEKFLAEGLDEHFILPTFAQLPSLLRAATLR